MNSFLDMAIPGLRCLNPGCQAEAPMGNRITFRQILYDGWTCSRCGWEYSGALDETEHGMFTVDVDESIHISDRAETEAAGANVAEGINVIETENEAAHLPSRDEMEQDDEELEAAKDKINGVLKDKIAEIDEAEQPKSIYDMNRTELVAILNRFDILLGGIPVSGKALSNDDIRSYIVNHVPTQYGPQQAD